MKTLEQQFRDWNQYFIGYGYGTGEMYTLKALKEFMAAIADTYGCYDYRKLESAVTPTVAWLLINILIEADIIEYGTSPRTGWLTASGKELKKYVDRHLVPQLYDIAVGADQKELYIYCSPDYCNCSPNDGTHNGWCVKNNRFWSKI